RQQSVQSQIRNLRYLFQTTGDCQRNPRPADRSPYGRASAAAFDLCRPASEAVTWNNRIFYVTASVPYLCPPEVSHGANISHSSRSTSRQSGDPQTVKSPPTEIVKPILLIVMAIVALGSIVARADAIDTEHLFGFTIGTDIGEVGEKEFESNTLSRLGK